MKTVAIIQARWGSTRQPGKVLLKLGETSVLEHVLKRCAQIVNMDAICCAVADDNASDPVAAEAARCGVAVWRGSANDVLERYRGAAEMMGADTVLRVTSDCPLIDPQICADVIALLHADSADYASNNMPPSWPHGLDCEAFTRSALEAAAETATEPHEREHVTPWIRNAPYLRKSNLAGPGGDVVEQRWTLDYPEDYAFLTALWQHMPPSGAIPSTADILAIIARHSELADINATRIDRVRLSTV